ncbi:SNARE associated Golgi protein [Reichenbachiella faecimaris]|uniref:TVP38/TMEM64 family membrane protein n=2 Tax=Reichenbachiella faecimaris TaxID=692418 RepID=A0A1W2GEM0_REIFA|nr:SNARE associated Golgi protein [Reichenbachiella faecimaris]
MIWMTIIPWLSTLTITYVVLAEEDWIRTFTLSSWLYFFIISIFSMGLAITPTTFISLLGGYFLGVKAVLPVVISYQLASLVGFFLAQRMDNNARHWIQKRFPKSASIFDNVEKQPWLTTFLARISPALPFGLMNVVLAISGVRLAPFIFGGLIGMLPRTLLFIWIGSQASFLIEALETKDHLVWLIVLSGIGIFGLYKLLKPKP